MSKPKKNPAAVALGRLGGKAKSEAKAKAARENARKPRPGRRAARANARKPRKTDE